MTDTDTDTDDPPRWAVVDTSDEPDDPEPDPGDDTGPPEGIILYTGDGDPVRVVLMDEHDDRLPVVANPEQGIYGYQSAETTITMLLERP